MYLKIVESGDNLWRRTRLKQICIKKNKKKEKEADAEEEEKEE